MRFLKKVSYKDIIREKDRNQFHYYENVADKYKEFELYLTQADLGLKKADLDSTQADLDSTQANSLIQKETLEELTTSLINHGAVIKAIHCPESWSITCNEKDGEKSSNYLSLCEVINDTENSRELFKNVLKIADIICRRQYQENNQISENEDEMDESDSTSNDRDDKQIIVILHEGCKIGCIRDDNGDCNEKNKYKVDAKEYGVIAEFVLDHVIMLCSIVNEQPVEEFMNLNAYKTAFSISDHIRANLISLNSFYKEEIYFKGW